MSSRIARRTVMAAVLVVCCAALWIWDSVRGRALIPTASATGWVLLLLVVLLALYGVRKWLPFLPWGRSRTWLRLHVLAGAVALFAFGLHLRWSAPNGIFEFVLAAVFLVLALSGVVGLWLSRTIPTRLSAVGIEVIYERIPTLRRQIRAESESLVRESVRRTHSMAIADFYEQRLRTVFERPSERWRNLRGDDRPWRRLEHDLDEFESCLGGTGRDILAALRAHVLRLHQLDLHHSLQGALKFWLFVHVPLTWGLLALAAVHVLVVHAFGGV